jgi:N-methylhydantoinase A
VTSARTFAYDDVNAALDELESRCRSFINGPGAGAESSEIRLSVEARYPHQVWELEVPLPSERIRTLGELEALCTAFHDKHRDVFAIADEESTIEFESWHARARCRIATPAFGAVAMGDRAAGPTPREVYFPESGSVTAEVWRLGRMPLEETLAGPALIQTSTTTILVDPGASFRLLPSGTLELHPRAEQTRVTPSMAMNET